jgi:hypothetical protein
MVSHANTPTRIPLFATHIGVRVNRIRVIQLFSAMEDRSQHRTDIQELYISFQKMFFSQPSQELQQVVKYV